MKQFLPLIICCLFATHTYSIELPSTPKPSELAEKEAALQQLIEKQKSEPSSDNSSAIKSLLQSIHAEESKTESTTYESFLDSTITYGSYSNEDSTYKTKYVYYDSLNPYSYIVSGWSSGASNWVYSYKNDERLNDFDEITYLCYYDWDKTTEEWIPYFKGVFEYDSVGNWLVDSYYYWDSSIEDWTNWYKYVYDDHDEYGNFRLEIYYDGNYSTDSWDSISTHQIEYTYDESGNILSEIYLEYDSDSESYINEDKFTWQYDAFGNDTLNKYFYWVDTNNAWTVGYKYERRYNESGNIISYSRSNWVDTANVWLNYYLYNFKYDSLENRSIDIYSLWDSASADYVLSTKRFYYYTITEVTIDDNDGTAIATTQDGQLKVYPNPTNGIIYLDDSDSAIKQFAVYDISGKTVLSSKSLNNNSIDITDLNGNIFFLKIETENAVNVVKILKK